MSVCEGQERGLWLVLENKQPVVAFPYKEQAEQYMPIHVAKREDVPIMEIVHVFFHDDYYQSLLRRPVRIPSVPPGVTATPYIPPKLGPGVVSPGGPAGGPIDYSKFREAIEKLKKIPTWEDVAKPEIYVPGGGGYATSGTA